MQSNNPVNFPVSDSSSQEYPHTPAFKPKKNSVLSFKYGVSLFALVIVAGGILALSQSALKRSQENRSDAATGDSNMQLQFMSDTTTMDGIPVGIT